MRISFLELGFLLIVAVFIITCSVYLLGKSSGISREMILHRCGIALAASLIAATGLMTHLLYYFPQVFEVEPTPLPAASEPEPTESQPEEIPLVDYAEILRNSEEYDGQEVRVAGRIADVSSSHAKRNVLTFQDRLGFDGSGGEFEVHLRQQSSLEGTVSDYFQQGQYVLLQGHWSNYAKYFICDVISTGEIARQEAQVFMDTWEAEGYGYADTLPITDYMDIVTSPRAYRRQRVRTVGKIFAPAEDSYSKSPYFYFLNREDNNTPCIKFYLQGCPPEMQEKCQDGEYVVLSGVVYVPTSGYPYLLECFVENTGNEARALAEQSEAARSERLTAEREAYFTSCQEYAYDELARYPDKYKEARIVLTGIVVQTRLDNLDNHILLDVGQGHMVYVSYYGKLSNDPEILVGDQITFYGECYGNTFYDTAPNETNTVPWVIARYSSFNQFDQ